MKSCFIFRILKKLSKQTFSNKNNSIKTYCNVRNIDESLVFDLEIILIFYPHYHTHSGDTSRPVNLAVVRWLVSYEDENEYDNDNGNEMED